MRHIKITLIVTLFVFSVPLLVLGQDKGKGTATPQRTKKEFMHAVINPFGLSRSTQAPINLQMHDLPRSIEVRHGKSVSGVPVISPFSKWNYYYLQASISWHPDTEYQDKYKEVIVPRGFVTDLASIPRPFWSILSPTDGYTYAAIIHDYLYWTQTLPRDDADKILEICMQEMEVEGWKVATIYNAVKEFGQSAWDTNAILKANGEQRILKKFPDNPKVTWEEWKKKKDVFED